MTAARIRVAATALLVAALVLWLGPQPFFRAAGHLGPGVLGVSVTVGAAATLAAAWRWRAVATALDVPVPWGWAVAAYYRSQFLNSVLPGGVVGDLHRALAHGRGDGRRSLALRAVAWERSIGQLVAVGLTVMVVLASGVSMAPLSGWLGLAAVALAGAVLTLGWLAWRRSSWPVASDVRRILDGARFTDLVVPSVLVALGHAAVFGLAVHRAAPGLAARVVLPLALVVLAISAVPVGVAGWGPREVATGALFPLVGASAAQGVEASVTYGLLALAATLPGAAVLARAPRPPTRARREAADA